MATSSAQSGFVESWQRGKSVIECNLHMLETEDFSDVTFLVGSEKHVVRAHRYVLASRSCVFHAMFCGRMAEQREIIIPDIEVAVFKAFLRFLYTDDVSINSENLTGLMYSARKYDIETLFTQSAAFLEKSLCEDNVCEILEKSHGYGETDLEEKALKTLRNSSLKVTKSTKFVDLCSSCFGSFLKSESLNLKEEEVFEASLSWIKAECEREEKSPSHENMRKVLGEMVYEIRFASLSLEFLTNVVGPSGILTDGERVMIMDRKVNTNVDITPFKSQVRKCSSRTQSIGSGIYYVSRYRHNFIEINPPGQHVICFSSNKPITLLGCQLYGPKTNQATCLNIKVLDDMYQPISEPVNKPNWNLSNGLNDIMFPDSIQIKTDRYYLISVSLSISTNVHGYGGSANVSEGGVDFKFSNSHTMPTRTSVEKGQIPALIWRLT